MKETRLEEAPDIHKYRSHPPGNPLVRLQRTVIFPFSPRCCTSGYLLGGGWRGPVRYILVHVGRPPGCVFNAPLFFPLSSQARMRLGGNLDVFDHCPRKFLNATGRRFPPWESAHRCSPGDRGDPDSPFPGETVRYNVGNLSPRHRYDRKRLVPVVGTPLPRVGLSSSGPQRSGG
jgi:hypothetical protein